MVFCLWEKAKWRRVDVLRAESAAEKGKCDIKNT